VTLGGPGRGVLSLAVCLSALAAAPLSAAAVKIWVCDSASDFSAGEARGVSVSVDGTLYAGRALEKVEGVAEAVLFAAAEGKGGELFVGTGDSGRVLRVSGGGKPEVYATLPEHEVTALRFGPDGALYAGGSPGGRVYRIEKGKATLYYETGAQYVWALSFSGPVLYVGTGLPGEIHRVASAGKGERVHASSDPHVRALFSDARGRVWAGTSGSGLVLRLEPGGRVATIYDSGKPEITAITADRSGRVWAAAGSAEVPGGGGEPISVPSSPSPARTSRPSGSGDDDDRVHPEVTISVSSPRVAPSRGSQHGGYSSEVLVFDEGEPARAVWTGNDEVVFDLETDSDGHGVLAATGPRGKLYAITPETSSLVRTFDEKQVTFLAGGDVGTNASSAVYRASGSSAAGEYVSPVKDTGRTSRFGAFRWEGETPSGTDVVFSFRSGESSMPDTTWSDWSAWQGGGHTLKVDAPDGRFLQWRARLRSDGDRIARVRRTEVAYRNRNAAPVIDSLSALEPAEVLTRSGSSSGTNVLESTAQDEKGIFTSLEEPKNEGSPRRLLRKGFRTLQWKATDPDGDALTYELSFRPAGGTRWLPLRADLHETSYSFDSSSLPDGEYVFRVTASDGDALTYELSFRPAGGTRWLPLRADLHETSYSFDSSSLPDGEYVFRVTASDGDANPGEAKVATRDSSPVRVDNTPPALRETSNGGGFVEIEATDAASPILEADYSVDAKRWVRIEPKDGLSDSPHETYRIALPPEAKGAYVLVRVMDAARNVATLSIVAP
jgi:hypothetical protein